jgi:hypothetical protein
MRRGTTLLAALGALAVAACGPAQAVVLAEIDLDNPEGEGTVTRPIGDLPVTLLPFDRDLIFDSLTAAASSPEPEIPADLLDAQTRVAALQSEWREADTQWGAGRDRLQEINRELQGVSRGSPQYRLLFGEFQEQETRVNAAERVKDQAFARFTALQDSIIGRAAEVRVVRDNWADEAFADYGEIQLAKIRASGRQVVADTTDANGVAQMAVPPGEWWVYARYDLPYEELYWNVRVQIDKGDPVEIRLNRANAQLRPKL